MAEEFCLSRRRRKRLRTTTTMSSSQFNFSFRGDVSQSEGIGEREGETFSDLTRRAISISSAEGQSPGLLTNEGDDDDTVVDLTNDSGVEDAELVDLTSPITEIDIDRSRMRYAPVSERERRGRRRMGGGSDVVVLDESDESTDEVQIMEPQHSVTSPQVTSTSSSEQNPCSPTKNLIKCPICMENALTFERRGSQVMVTTCGHVFCNSCIRRAISEQKRCPTCRKRLNVRQIHPLYLSM